MKKIISYQTLASEFKNLRKQTNLFWKKISLFISNWKIFKDISIIERHRPKCLKRSKSNFFFKLSKRINLKKDSRCLKGLKWAVTQILKYWVKSIMNSRMREASQSQTRSLDLMSFNENYDSLHLLLSTLLLIIQTFKLLLKAWKDQVRKSK